MRETGNIRSLEYQFIATPKDNGAVYKCVASHANVPEPHSETNITVNVFCKCLSNQAHRLDISSVTKSAVRSSC